MTVHRFIPAAAKHGDKTGCGIKLACAEPAWSLQKVGTTDDGALIYVTAKGEPFDCPRCRRVLELRHSPR